MVGGLEKLREAIGDVALLPGIEQLVCSVESITLLSARLPVQDGPDLVFDLE